jgi:hypothetical protein
MMLTIPTAYGTEFRQPVIDVARKGEAPFDADCEEFRAVGHAQALDSHRSFDWWVGALCRCLSRESKLSLPRITRRSDTTASNAKNSLL